MVPKLCNFYMFSEFIPSLWFQVIHVYIYRIQFNKLLFKIIIISTPFFNYNMKRNLLLYVIAPIMSMLYSKIKIEIDTNNDELLETIWEHIRTIWEPY